MYIKPKRIMSGEKLLKELMETRYQELMDWLGQWHPDAPVHELTEETLMDDLAYSLCFCFADPLWDYVELNYELVETYQEGCYAESYEDFESFIDEVTNETTPFHHDALYEDDILKNTLEACVKQLKTQSQA